MSIYMPTHRAGDQIQQDPIRLKNLLGRAEEELLERGLRRPAAEALLQPARDLLPDQLFWQNQADGLALFCTDDAFYAFRLPFAFEEQVVVTRRFHLKPLLRLLSGDGRFLILALSQDRVRLLQGTRYAVGEVDLEGVPHSLAEALRLEDPEQRLQWHTTTGPPHGQGGAPTAGTGAERSAAFHGSGAPSEDQKDRILRYFQKVNAGMSDLLADLRLPLVLIGVDYLLPIYRQANTYRYVVEEGVEGSPDDVDAAELHQAAWNVVAPLLARQRQEAADLYRQLEHTERASGALEEVIPAAHYGKVDALFVALGLERWGTFDPKVNRLAVHEEAAAGDEDLLNLAAVQTLLHDGTVYAVESEQVPGDHPLAALFRY
ncbi:MAG: hypothetical protein P8129_02305 [Anaerolineae bacterium]